MSNLIYSELSRTVTVEGVSVQVQIYRQEYESKWALEVVNEWGGATVWEESFDSDQEALQAFARVVVEEGMEAFLDSGGSETLH